MERIWGNQGNNLTVRWIQLGFKTICDHMYRNTKLNTKQGFRNPRMISGDISRKTESHTSNLLYNNFFVVLFVHSSNYFESLPWFSHVLFCFATLRCSFECTMSNVTLTYYLTFSSRSRARSANSSRSHFRRKVLSMPLACAPQRVVRWIPSTLLPQYILHSFCTVFFRSLNLWEVQNTETAHLRHRTLRGVNSAGQSALLCYLVIAHSR